MQNHCVHSIQLAWIAWIVYNGYLFTVHWHRADHVLTYVLTRCWPTCWLRADLRADHVLTTYLPTCWPLADHVLTYVMTYVLTTYWPRTDHVLTTCWPRADHVLTTYWPRAELRADLRVTCHLKLREGTFFQPCSICPCLKILVVTQHVLKKITYYILYCINFFKHPNWD